jgi:hypothetical protein
MSKPALFVLAGEGHLIISGGEKPNTVDIGMYLVQNVTASQLRDLAAILQLKAAELGDKND